MQQNKIFIAFADDLPNERESIIRSIDKLNNCKLLFSACSGRDLILELHSSKKLPQIILMDMEMPSCDGLLTTIICKRLFPSIKIVGLSSHCSETIISEFITEGGSAFLSKYLLDKNSISYMVYKEKNVFENYLERVLNDDSAFLDPALLIDLDRKYIKVSTSSIIKNQFPKLKEHEIIYLQLNAAGFSKPEIKTIMCREISTIKKYFEKLSKIFGAQNHSDLTNICLNFGIIKMVNLYETFKIFE